MNGNSSGLIGKALVIFPLVEGFMCWMLFHSFTLCFLQYNVISMKQFYSFSWRKVIFVFSSSQTLSLTAIICIHSGRILHADPVINIVLMTQLKRPSIYQLIKNSSIYEYITRVKTLLVLHAIDPTSRPTVLPTN